VAARIAANPYVFIGRRHRQGGDAAQYSPLAQELLAGREVIKALASAPAANSRIAVADVDETSHAPLLSWRM
jgi:hypothetical protein